MGRLTGVVAIVTGGACGMGASHVRGLVAEGARVVIGDVLDEDGRALADELGDAAVFVHRDITDDKSWKAAVARTEEVFGPMTTLLNNAGVVQWKPWLKTTPRSSPAYWTSTSPASSSESARSSPPC
jgi:3alpha(or 20beta)-hydroxysteroid dehydrogenase